MSGSGGGVPGLRVASERFTVSVRQRDVKHLCSLVCGGYEEARKGAGKGDEWVRDRQRGREGEWE